MSYEDLPITRAEYITALVHLYRGEVGRATSWRIRLDTTTNWAILTAASLLAFSFRDGQNPHWALLMGQLVVLQLLAIEARRYRIYDVWRARLRKIEENFYLPILRRDPVSPQPEWGEKVAEDLLRPTFKLTFLEAMRARFVRNYWAIFLVLDLAWLLKVLVSPREAHSLDELRENLAGGFLPWWPPVLFVLAINLAFVALVFCVRRQPRDLDGFWSSDGTPGAAPHQAQDL